VGVREHGPWSARRPHMNELAGHLEVSRVVTPT